MSRKREEFYNSNFYYPGIERWGVEPPPGSDCNKCAGDMFIHSNGVTWICSECGYQRQRKTGESIP